MISGKMKNLLAIHPTLFLPPLVLSIPLASVWCSAKRIKPQVVVSCKSYGNEQLEEKRLWISTEQFITRCKGKE